MGLQDGVVMCEEKKSASVYTLMLKIRGLSVVIKDIVADYIQHKREQATEEYRWFANQRTLEEAVSCAALALSKAGKRLSHQRRIQKSVLVKSRRRLLASLPTIAKAKSFEELHQIVKSIIRPIRGIGALTVYDTALRIGAKLKLEPKVVFIHAGARIGAKLLGLDISQDSIAVTDFPSAFQKLRPREIEDALCHYRDCLNGSSTLGASTLRTCAEKGCGAKNRKK